MAYTIYTQLCGKSGRRGAKGGKMNHLEYGKTLLGKSEDPKQGNNRGFKDKAFEKLMRIVGWIPGYSWCALFVRLCVKNGLPDKWNKLKALLNPSVMKTLNNLLAAGYTLSRVPTPGAIVFWQLYKNGKPTAQGHIGIVNNEGITAINFQSLEGNTDVAGSRDGGTTAMKTRIIDFTKKKDGLTLIGFVTIDI